MSGSRKKPARRHHVVPKFYLRRFSNDREQLTRLPLGGNPHPQSINDATVQKDFYALGAGGENSDAFEKMLAALEQEAAPAFVRVVDSDAWPPSFEDRYAICSWIALQHLRTEAIRTSGEEIYRSMSKLEVGVSTTGQMRENLGLGEDVPDQKIEEIRARMLATADTFKVDNIHHLRAIAEMLPGMTNLVRYRPWALIRFKKRALGTSDTPVGLVPHPDVPHIGTTLGGASKILVPLGRRVGLCLGGLGGYGAFGKCPEGVLTGTTSQARLFNEVTVRNARRVLYHHPEDSPFAGMSLPEPRLSEVNIPHGQINGLIEGWAKTQGRASGLPHH